MSAARPTIASDDGSRSEHAKSEPAVWRWTEATTTSRGWAARGGGRSTPSGARTRAGGVREERGYEREEGTFSHLREREHEPAGREPLAVGPVHDARREPLALGREQAAEQLDAVLARAVEPPLHHVHAHVVLGAEQELEPHFDCRLVARAIVTTSRSRSLSEASSRDVRRDGDEDGDEDGGLHGALGWPAIAWKKAELRHVLTHPATCTPGSISLPAARFVTHEASETSRAHASDAMQSQERPQQAQRPQIVVQSFEDFQTNCFLLEMNLSRGARARRSRRARARRPVTAPAAPGRPHRASARPRASARSRVTVARQYRFRARRPDRPGA